MRMARSEAKVALAALADSAEVLEALAGRVQALWNAWGEEGHGEPVRQTPRTTPRATPMVAGPVGTEGRVNGLSARSAHPETFRTLVGSLPPREGQLSGSAARRGGTERFGGGTAGRGDGSPEADAVAAGERGGSGPVRPAQGGGRAGQRPDQARPGLSAVLLPGTGGGRGGVGPGVPVPQPAQDVPKPARRGPGRPAPERRGALGARRTARSVRTTEVVPVFWTGC